MLSVKFQYPRKIKKSINEVKKMWIAKKIRLHPTKEQEILFWKSAGVARWSFNYFLAENDRVYKEQHKYLSGCEVRRYINNVLKKTTHTWLKEVGSNVMKQGVQDAERALKDYMSGLRGKPHFKTKHKSQPCFYVNYETLTRKPNGFRGEKIGFVKTSELLPKLKDGEKYSNPRISYDGKYWYLSISYEIQKIDTVKLTNESLGIDLGVKDLAICSDGKTYKNINKSKEVCRLKKKLKREQRKLSRKMEHDVKGYCKNRKPIFERPLTECKNFQKQKKKVALLHRRITNIRNNYLHQTTTEIVNKYPKRIVMETLNINGMMKNKHLAEKIAEEKFYEFKRQIKYKAEFKDIQVIEVSTWYPSSKLCSCCGHIKKDLKLSDRIYICSECGLKIDRDFNASLNLANYEST